MLLHRLLSLGLLAGVGIASSLGLSSCTHKTDVAPEQPCGTAAIVRLCPGKTMACVTEHTTLELADGTRLRPSGALWTAYLGHQVGGESLLIGYTPGAALPTNDVGDVRATISCLTALPIKCGTVNDGDSN